MYCKQCGSQLADGARYCSRCGAQPDAGDPAAALRRATAEIDGASVIAALRGPAIGAAAAFGLGLLLALVTNIVLIAASSKVGFSLGAAISILLYGSLGVGSVGSAASEFGGSISYSLSFTLLGGFVLMLAALAYAGWLASRHGRPQDRGSLNAGVRTAVLFAVVTFIVSFFVGYDGMHPQHFESLLFPLIFALLAAPAGARIERDGFGFWRARVDALAARRPGAVQALGSGFDALVRSLKLTTIGVVVALVVLAINYPHAAGEVLGGRQLIAEVLLLPLYLPHFVGVMFTASQGIAYRVGVVGTLGTLGSLSGSTGVDVSIFGGGQAHVPAYFLLALLIPLATVLWGGFLAAERRGGSPSERAQAALVASAPFVLCTWIVCALVGVTVKAGDSVLSGGLGIGPLAVDAIFLPLLWGPLGFLLGAGLQVWRKGELSTIGVELRSRAGSAPPPPSAASRPPATAPPPPSAASRPAAAAPPPPSAASRPPATAPPPPATATSPASAASRPPATTPPPGTASPATDAAPAAGAPGAAVPPPAAAPRFCPSCGQPRSGAGRFCTACGAPLPDTDVATSSDPPPAIGPQS